MLLSRGHGGDDRAQRMEGGGQWRRGVRRGNQLLDSLDDLQDSRPQLHPHLLRDIGKLLPKEAQGTVQDLSDSINTFQDSAVH